MAEAEGAVVAPSGAPYLLHALWQDDTGLMLWVEQAEGHRILSHIPAVEIPGADRLLFGALKGGTEKTVELVLHTPKGKEVRRNARVVAFMPEKAVDVLAQLQEFTDSAAMAPDVRFFVDTFRGLEAFARSGRAFVAMQWEAEQWWPMWRLPDGLAEIAWRSQVIQRTPPVLVANGGVSVAEDFINRMFHWAVNALLADLEEPASSRQSFVRALLQSDALPRSGPTVASALSRWRNSADAEDIRLLLAIEEPTVPSFDMPDLKSVDLAGLLDIARDELGLHGGVPDKTQWPVRMYFRVGVSAPERLDPAMIRRSVLQVLRPQLQKAQEAFPPFAQAQSAGYGLDLLLSSEQVIELVKDGIPKLAKTGIDVMLPANWKNAEVQLALRTALIPQDPTGPAGRRMEPKLGFDQLVEYQWKVSVGDVEVDEAELRQLATSSSGLVRLRDKWVYADPTTTREALRFLIEQTKAGEETGTGQASLKELHFAGGAESKAPVEVAPPNPDWINNVVDFNMFQSADSAGEEDSHGKGDDDTHGDAENVVRSLFQVPLPAGFMGQLRSYQHRGLEWLAKMSMNGFGVILADDMGLGKTIQILALLQHEKEQPRELKPTLLVVPTGVLRNWANEAAKFAPELRVGLLHGSNRPKEEELKKFIESHDVIVTTYGVATRDLEQLREFRFEHVIADEAQAIKNPNSQASRALRALDSRQNIAMTGTPVENDLGELRAIMDFCNPGMLGTANVFRNRFAIPIERDNNEEILELLRRLTAPFILRRMKTDPNIAPDLPQKNEHVESVVLTPEQAMLYEGAVRDLEEKIQLATINGSIGFKRRGIVLAGIAKLKQICNHPAHYQHDGSAILAKGQHRSGKLERLDQLLDEILRKGERALIFTQFVEFGNMLVPYLSRRLGVEIPFIQGSLSPKQRETLVNEFNGPDGAPVMVLSTMAAGVGINLTAANHVIHLDRWWNPAVENQATDRTYRIGQERDVHVHKMVSVGTLEERIDELIFEKSMLADAVVKAGETKLTELDFQQLRQLWQLDHSRLDRVKKSQAHRGRRNVIDMRPDGEAEHSTSGDSVSEEDTDA